MFVSLSSPRRVVSVNVLLVVLVTVTDVEVTVTVVNVLLVDSGSDPRQRVGDKHAKRKESNIIPIYG